LQTDWDEGFSYLSKYVEQQGHTRVPISYKTGDGYRLGGWVRTQRGRRDLLTPERESRLKSLDGWVWDPWHAVWEEGFSYLSKYVEQEGHARVPNSYKTEGGFKLGRWVEKQRSKRDKLTSERESKLESLNGWVWDSLQAAWEEGFLYLSKYVKQERNARVRASYKTDDGYRLGQWVSVQRINRDQLSPERTLRLESLNGWVWDPLKEDWEETKIEIGVIRWVGLGCFAGFLGRGFFVPK